MLEQLDHSASKELSERRQVTPVDNPLHNDWAAIALICLACLFAFGNSLQANFSSDDILHVHYAHKSFNGHPDLLLKAWTEAWPDRSFHLHYRPGVELSYALDYLIWQGKPFGYHLSNLLFHMTSATFLFLSTRLLTIGRSRFDGHSIALLSALIFATFPAHSEPVCWIAGRVDCLCAAFLFISLWSFLKHAQSCRISLKVLSLSCFAACLLTKEMGACLPLIVTLWSLLYETSSTLSLQSRLRDALAHSLPYWGMLATYLCVRALVLGDPIGGYAGSGADLVWRDLVPRWLHPLWLTALAFPLRPLANGGCDLLAQTLQALYVLTGATLLWRIIRARPDKSDIRFAGFLTCAFALALLPVIPVFYISPLLQGGRFFYLPSAFLAGLLAIGLWGRSPSNKHKSRGVTINLMLSTGLIATFATAAQRNNLAWIESGLQLSAMQSQISDELKRMPEEEQLVVLNLPNSHNGTHLFYLFEMLQRFVAPPFQSLDLSGKIAALEPVSFGQNVMLNKTRLQESIAQKDLQFYLWDKQQRKLCPLSKEQLSSLSGNGSEGEHPRQSDNELNLNIREIEFRGAAGHSFRQCRYESKLPIRPGSYDWLELVATACPVAERTAVDTALEVSWAPVRRNFFDNQKPFQLPLCADGKPHRYLLPLGEDKNWSLSESIDGLYSQVLTPNVLVAIKSARLLSGRMYSPHLAVHKDNFVTLNNGLHQLRGDHAVFDFDATAVPNA